MKSALANPAALCALLITLCLAGDQTSTPAAEPQYVYKLQPARVDMLKKGATKREDEALGRHYNRLQGFTRKGVVIFAGRTLNTDETSFGIVVFRADSEGAAREFMNRDPAVQEGVLKATLFPFRVSLAEGKPIF